MSKFLNILSRSPRLEKRFYFELEKILGKNNLLTDPADCWAYGYDNSRRHHLPDMVVFPQNQQQVQEIVAACYIFNIAVTARGRGTGTTGASIPSQGGLVISFEKLNQIVKFCPDDRYLCVEPGITNQEVQDFLRPHGFFWPPDPTSAPYCTIGGNLACNAAGPKAVKYGTPRENTLGLNAVIGTGETVQLGTYTTKGVVGYDLTRLLIGSEGTLGIITQATLKLTPIPQAKRTMRAIYRDLVSAAQAISAIMAQPVIPCALEFIDGNALALVREYTNLTFPQNAQAILIIEVDGQEDELDRSVHIVSGSAQNSGLISCSSAVTDQETESLWQIRKALAPAMRKAAPKKINEDVVVPVTQIPDLLTGLNEISKLHQIPIINFGHAGNGNIHVNLLLSGDKIKQPDQIQQCLDDVFALVLRLNGTLSGEHGVGIEKRDYIDRELDDVSLRLMRQIKMQFDPNGILNPNKIFPAAIYHSG